MAMTQTQAQVSAPRQSARGGSLWYRFHFLIRFLGVTGLLAAVVGLVLAHYDGLLGSWQTFVDEARLVIDLHKGPVSVFLILIGGLAFAFALLVEFLLAMGLIAGRRSAMGFNSLVQIVLAAALLVGVNVFSRGIDLSGQSLFGQPLQVADRPIKIDGNYRLFDWTRDRHFTLEDSVRQELEKLKGETTVV